MADADEGQEPGEPDKKKRRRKRKASKKSDAKRRRAERAQQRANLIWAIAHPLRRRVLRTLVDSGEARSPMEMARSFDLPVSALAYHVKILLNLGAVELTDEQTARGAIEHFYDSTIEDDPPIETLLEETRDEDDE
jgi:DNA-binding transcriptional ArsR family regulator